MSNTLYDSDDGDDAVCPLCCEPMDLSDQNFLPCPCGYRVCMWCWHRIKENYTNLCPACRSEYSDDPHAFAAVDKDEVIKNENKKKQRAKQKDTDTAGAAAAAAAAREHQNALHLRHHHQHQQHLQHLHREQVAQQQGGRGSGGGGGGGGGASSLANRRDLASMRVVQRNLVYATGLPAGLDSEEVLRRPENFGQYGRIYKIAVSSSQTSERNPSSISAHITFAHKEDALACILATDGFWVEGRQVRSNFGTTKYCATYLRNSPCQNPDCLYLHELGDEEDRFTKDEIQQRSLLAPPIPPGSVTVTGGGGPSGTGKRCTSPFLPPPVYESSENGTGGAARMTGHCVASAASVAQRAGGRGAKPPAQIRRDDRGPPQASLAASKVSTSVGIAWGGAGALNGPSAQPVGRPSAAEVLRRKTSAGAASPTASPHLQAHDPARLQEEWPSLADTAAPPPAPTPTPAAQTTGRRNRRKKEKLTAQLFPPQSQEEGDSVASPTGPPVSPPQEPAPAPAPSPAQPPPAARQSSAASQATASLHPAGSHPPPSQPPMTQPPVLGPLAGATSLPQASSVLAAAAGPGESAGRVRLAAGQETPLARTMSARSNTSSSSMFSNPFFSSNGAARANAPMATATTAPAPPGFSELPSASAATSAGPAAMVSPTATAVTTLSSPPKAAQTQPSRSLFGEHFGGDSVFNGGMFSSSAIGGGLFAGSAGGGASSLAGKIGSSPSGDSDSTDSPAVLESTPSPHVDQSSPVRVDWQTSPVLQPRADVDESVAGLLNTPLHGSGKVDAGSGSMCYSSSSADIAGPSEYDFGAASAATTPAVASPSPFGAAFGGGHFGGAFGSALFPVSSHQGGRMHGNGGFEDTDGPGADLSVDPFANSSGALAAMLGVTLPPVDSHRSLASRMRSGTAASRLNPAQESSPLRTLTPPRGAYGDYAPDVGRGRDGTVHGVDGHRGIAGDRGGGHTQSYGGDQGGAQHEHQASRFSFAQGLNPALPLSPARGSPSMGPDLRGPPGGMGSPPHPGAHHHPYHHHQSHAHRPFGTAPITSAELGEYGGTSDGQFLPHHPHRHHYQQQQQQQQQPSQQRPPTQHPQQQQQQPQHGYSIQNGMAFLQKVLPGVSLSYGDRHSPAGAGGGQGQQGQQGQGASAAPSGGVGWGDNAAGQRVDPAQAFGSSLWTMAPAPNAPRQPQGSRGGGYSAW